MQVYVKYNFRKMTYAGKIIDNVNIAKTTSEKAITIVASKIGIERS